MRTYISRFLSISFVLFVLQINAFAVTFQCSVDGVAAVQTALETNNNNNDFIIDMPVVIVPTTFLTTVVHVTSTGSLTVSGTLTLNEQAGDPPGPAPVYAETHLIIDDGGSVVVDDLNGAIGFQIYNSGSLTINNGGSMGTMYGLIENTATGVIDIGGDFTFETGSTLNNSGIITVGGLLTAQQPGGPAMTPASINHLGGAMTVNELNVTNAALINVDPGQVIDVVANMLIRNGGSGGNVQGRINVGGDFTTRWIGDFEDGGIPLIEKLHDSGINGVICVAGIYYNDATSILTPPDPAAELAEPGLVEIVPNPVISGPATACNGATTAFTVSSTINLANTYTWGVSAGGSFLPADQGSTPIDITWAATGAQTVNLQEVTPKGCFSDAAPHAITINETPVSHIAGDASICGGLSTNLTVTFPTGSPNFDFTLQRDGLPATNVAYTNETSPIVIPVTTAGVYSVHTISDTNCPGAHDASTATIIVSPLPTSTITGDATTCDNASTDLTVALTGSPNYDFVVRRDGLPATDLTYTNEVGPNVTIPVTAVGVYSVISLSDANCTGTAMNGTATIATNITPSATVTAAPPVVCNTTAGGSTINLTSLVTAGDMGGTWTDDDNYFNGGVGVVVPTTALDFDGENPVPATYDFTYTLTAAAPCVDPTYTSTLSIQDCSCPIIALQPIADLCNGSGTVNLALHQVGSDPGVWSLDPTAVASPPTVIGGIFDATGVTPGDYIVRYTLNGPFPAGCTTTDGTLTIRVNPLPTSTLTGDATLCGLNTTNLTVTLTGSGNYTFVVRRDGDALTDMTFTNVSSPHVFPVTSNGVYEVISLTDDNCTGVPDGSTATVMFNVLPTSTITGDATTCDAASTNLIVALTGSPNYDFVVRRDGLPATDLTYTNEVGPSVTIPVTTAGVYSVISLSDAHCTGTAMNGMATIVSYTTPTLTVTNPLTPYCNTLVGSFPNSIDLSTYASGSAGTWADTDNIAANGATSVTLPTINLVNTTPNTYQFTFTTNTAIAPCLDVSGISSIVVEDCNCPSVATVDPPAICAVAGNTVNMDANTIKLTPELGAWTLTGLPAGLPVPPVLTGASLDVAGATAGTYVFTWTIDPAMQATMDPLCPISSTVDLIINGIPTAVISGVTTYCEDDNLALTGAGGTGYSWTYPATSIRIPSTTAAVTISTVTTADAGDYGLIVTDANGCVSPPVSETVDVNTRPIVNSIAPAGLLCEGESITVDASVTPTTGVSYAWTTPTGNQTTDQLLINPADPLVNSGDYTLVLTSVAGCVSDPLTEPIIINPNPVPNLGRDLEFCPGSGDVTVIEQTGLQGAYTWSLNGVAVSSAPDSYTSTEVGYVVVVVIDANGCTGTADMYINEKCPPDVFPANAFMPEGSDATNHRFVVAVPSGVTDDDFDYYDISIFDRWGELLFKAESVTQHWDGMYRDKLSPAGAYVYIINYAYTIDNNQITERLMGKITLVR